MFVLLVLISVQEHDVFRGHFRTPGTHNGYVTSVCFPCHYNRIPPSIGHINFKIHPSQRWRDWCVCVPQYTHAPVSPTWRKFRAWCAWFWTWSTEKKSPQTPGEHAKSTFTSVNFLNHSLKSILCFLFVLANHLHNNKTCPNTSPTEKDSQNYSAGSCSWA